MKETCESLGNHEKYATINYGNRRMRIIFPAKVRSVKSIEEKFYRQGKEMNMQTGGIQEHQREKDRKATS